MGMVDPEFSIPNPHTGVFVNSILINLARVDND